MFYKKKSSKSFKKKSSTYKKKYVKKTPSLAIKKYVNRAIHKNIENKCIQLSEKDQFLTTYQNNTSLFVLPMIPYTSFVALTATNQSSRFGNQVQTRKCIFSFALRPNKYDSIFNTKVVPQHVIMIIGKLKNMKPQAPSSTDFAKLYQNGASSAAPGTSLLDLINPLNTDYFTIYKKLIYKVGWSQNSSTGSQGPGGTDGGFQYYSNNDFKMNIVKRMDLTKYCPKMLKFNDGSTQPTNDGLWCWAWSQPADGINGGSRPLYIDWSLHYEYEDA